MALMHPILTVKTEAEVFAPHSPPVSVEADDMATEEAGIPFVPSSERKRMTFATADTIITVGQRSQQKKKRKRELVPNGTEGDVEMPNPSAEPNLLDAGEVKVIGPVAKKRNKGKLV